MNDKNKITTLETKVTGDILVPVLRQLRYTGKYLPTITVVPDGMSFKISLKVTHPPDEIAIFPRHVEAIKSLTNLSVESRESGGYGKVEVQTVDCD